MAATVWKGQLTFGLVSVPIKLFRAARAEKVHMNLLHRQTGGRVRRVFVPAEELPQPDAVPDFPTGHHPAESPRLPSERIAEAISERSARPPDSTPTRGISESDLVRGFEYEKGKYAEFERRELENLAPRNSREMQIIEFVKLAEVDPVYLENSYYVAPERHGEKPYALLYEAMHKTGQCALTEFVMHRRDHIMLLRAGRHGIIGHSLFHDDEIRKETEFHADSTLVVPREMDLAVKLIDALVSRFEPEKFKDKYRERLNVAISERMARGTREATAAEQAAPVVDIMAALKASLTQAKKPAARESGGAIAPGKKKRIGGNG
jgi:DNA end-binding protein Ku